MRSQPNYFEVVLFCFVIVVVVVVVEVAFVVDVVVHATSKVDLRLLVMSLGGWWGGVGGGGGVQSHFRVKPNSVELS